MYTFNSKLSIIDYYILLSYIIIRIITKLNYMKK